MSWLARPSSHDCPLSNLWFHAYETYWVGQELLSWKCGMICEEWKEADLQDDYTTSASSSEEQSGIT